MRKVKVRRDEGTARYGDTQVKAIREGNGKRTKKSTKRKKNQAKPIRSRKTVENR